MLGDCLSTGMQWMPLKTSLVSVCAVSNCPRFTRVLVADTEQLSTRRFTRVLLVVADTEHLDGIARASTCYTV